MPRRLHIVLSQLNQIVGALVANADAMLAVRAAHGDADLILFPELQLPGYPAEDLVLKPAFAAACEAELARMRPNFDAARAKAVREFGRAQVLSHLKTGVADARRAKRDGTP